MKKYFDLENVANMPQIHVSEDLQCAITYSEKALYNIQNAIFGMSEYSDLTQDDYQLLVSLFNGSACMFGYLSRVMDELDIQLSDTLPDIKQTKDMKDKERFDYLVEGMSELYDNVGYMHHIPYPIESEWLYRMSLEVEEMCVLIYHLSINFEKKEVSSW